MTTIINYGMGNLGSIVNMFKRIGACVQVSDKVEEIAKAEKLLLPGVGAFDTAIKCIDGIEGLRDVLNMKVQVEKIPLLGICLGMQLLTNNSEEGKLSGLAYIPGKTLRFEASTGLKVPHMGWNLVKEERPSALIQGLPEDARFYFVHSYYVKVEQPEHQIMTSNYGVDFDSIIQKDNIFGAQFHPEKSHRFGMKLLENFSKL